MNINRQQANLVTDAARQLRPSWDALTTTNLLLQLDGTFAELMAHALRIAADPTNRTPRMLTTTPIRPDNAHTDPDHGPKCGICGRSRRMCDYVRAKEIRLGIPDPHHFETPDQPDAPHPSGVAIAKAAIPTINRELPLPYVPADLATEAAAPIPPDDNQEQHREPPPQQAPIPWAEQ